MGLVAAVARGSPGIGTLTTAPAMPIGDLSDQATSADPSRGAPAAEETVGMHER